MAKVSPISRSELIRKLRRAGFKGPIGGGRHSCMKKDGKRIIIPNPHQGDIGAKLVRKIMKQSGLTVEEWEIL